MKQTPVTVQSGTSAVVKEFGYVVVSVRQVLTNDCDAVVGYPGLPNVLKRMKVGDPVLFQTPTDGLIEVRVIALSAYSKVEFLITEVAPGKGIAAGFIDSDPYNAAFTTEELQRISESIDMAKEQMRGAGLLTSEQLHLISRKLDEIESASRRLGRKDWINYVAGSLTGLCVQAAFTEPVSRMLFQTVNSSFQWLFSHGVLFLAAS